MSRTKKIIFAALMLLLIIIIATSDVTGAIAGAIRAGVVGVLLIFLYYLIFITKIREPLDTSDHLLNDDD